MKSNILRSGRTHGVYLTSLEYGKTTITFKNQLWYIREMLTHTCTVAIAPQESASSFLRLAFSSELFTRKVLAQIALQI